MTDDIIIRAKPRLITRRTLGKLAAPTVFAAAMAPGLAFAKGKRLAYITPGLDLPYWRTLSNGIAAEAKKHGASSVTYDSHNSAQTQLTNAQDAIAKNVDGIILSPTDTSTAPSVLAAAARARIPVVIADIGTSGGEYLSFVISDNRKGAYGIGKVLATELKATGRKQNTVGLVTISLARQNGKDRTAGFMQAMDEAGIKRVALSQMQTYTADETFKFVQDMLTAHPEMDGLFVETDEPTIGALRAIRAAHRQKTMKVAAFDGIPEFIKMIEDGTIVGSGMQQPYLFGTEAAKALFQHFAGQTPPKRIEIPIIVVDKSNVAKEAPIVRKTTFGLS
ncbi:MAG: substrate-binding domain-containing protein [Rhodospirillales bacterium]|uniref:substrate-binding domain-containing protein n=1 Tax=Acidiphilium multivorum TaxID=62140 RepID=UPI001F4C3777|nr:substrate-binding domain-containing protein [Acidiphilium multivorum]MBU6357726.1 substrate-binding domain-containing protein [Rhodospirillales bacterium]